MRIPIDIPTYSNTTGPRWLINFPKMARVLFMAGDYRFRQRNQMLDLFHQTDLKVTSVVNSPLYARAEGSLSGRRFNHGACTTAPKPPRTWSTRQDPLANIWLSELVPLLEKTPELTSFAQESYPHIWLQRSNLGCTHTFQSWNVCWKITC